MEERTWYLKRRKHEKEFTTVGRYVYLPAETMYHWWGRDVEVSDKHQKLHCKAFIGREETSIGTSSDDKGAVWLLLAEKKGEDEEWDSLPFRKGDSPFSTMTNSESLRQPPSKTRLAGADIFKH